MPVFIKASGGGYVCDQVSSLAAQVGFATAGTAVLTWTKPTDVNFKGMVIRYKIGGYPTSPTDGTNAYDSNDATPVSTIALSGLTDGTLYYFRAFAYCYEGATRVYNDQVSGAQASAMPVQLKGTKVFTSSGSYIIPAGVTSIDIFLVGGGGGGGSAISSYGNGVGAGGGYTKTVKNIPVTPGQVISAAVGGGGGVEQSLNYSHVYGYNGGASSVTIGGTTYTANGGYGAGLGLLANLNGQAALYSKPGDGGSGGSAQCQAGGSNGADGYKWSGALAYEYGHGQGVTTREFDDAAGTLYAGGGGGGGITEYGTSYGGAGGAGGGGKGGDIVSGGGAALSGVNGTANTGGGGGGAASKTSYYDATFIAPGGAGGSGLVKIRWGY